MMELNATLDFACCGCDESVSVTVQCKGDSLWQDSRESLAKVLVPCPGCGQINQVLFDHTGTIRSVQEHMFRYRIPEPSIN